MLTSVLLDLDGTLVDSAPGILGSVRRAIEEAGLEVPESAIGTHLLGPPLYRSLPAILGDAGAAEVVPRYRRIYGDGGYLDGTPYPGIDELLRALAGAGVTMAVATSKAEPFARSIVAQHGWTDLFTEVVGDTLAGERPTKASVVAEALRRLDGSIGTDLPLMVGDRVHDVEGSAEHGLSCLSVGWGYAQPGELEAAGVERVFATVADLRAELLGST